MHDHYSELGTPDAALVSRFNTFVAHHAGRYAFSGGSVLLETYNFDALNDPAETGHVIEITETIELDTGHAHSLTTSYHSHGGVIGKSIGATTQDERQARQRKTEVHQLEQAVEAALTGDDDTDRVITSLIGNRLRSVADLRNLLQTLSRPGAEETATTGLEISDLLDDMEAVVSPGQTE